MKGTPAVRVLVIEENSRTVKDIAFCLEVRYPDVVIVPCVDGAKATEMIEEEIPDLAMVGSSLKNTDTLELVKSIREFSDVPLLILGDVKTDMDTSRYLEAGADDAISQPFSPMELLARVKALLRRTRGLGFRQERSISIGGRLTIDFDTHEVFVSGEKVKLTPIEYVLLSELVRNEGRIMTNRVLLERAWGPEYTDDPSYVKKYIYRLRSKLEPDATSPRMLINERGVGYRFVRPGKG